jgi:hypothetical protein
MLFDTPIANQLLGFAIERAIAPNAERLGDRGFDIRGAAVPCLGPRLSQRREVLNFCLHSCPFGNLANQIHRAGEVAPIQVFIRQVQHVFAQAVEQPLSRGIGRAGFLDFLHQGDRL